MVDTISVVETITSVSLVRVFLLSKFVRGIIFFLFDFHNNFFTEILLCGQF